MTPAQLRKKFQELVDNASEMYPHGNDGKEAAEELIEFWMEHRHFIKWAFWHGTGRQSTIIDCYDGPPISTTQNIVGGSGNSQVIK